MQAAETSSTLESHEGTSRVCAIISSIGRWRLLTAAGSPSGETAEASQGQRCPRYSVMEPLGENETVRMQRDKLRLRRYPPTWHVAWFQLLVGTSRGPLECCYLLISQSGSLLAGNQLGVVGTKSLQLSGREWLQGENELTRFVF